MNPEADRWFWIIAIGIFAGSILAGRYILARKRKLEDHPDIADLFVGIAGLGLTLVIVLVTLRWMSQGRIALSTIGTFGISYLGNISAFRFLHWLWMVIRAFFVKFESY